MSARDLTSAVMGELGYMQVAPAVARRRARRRLLARAGMTVLTLGLALGAVSAHRTLEADETAGAELLSVPEALGHDLDRQRDRVQGTIRCIRNLLPAAPAVPVYEALPEAVERSGMGPIDDLTWIVANET